jgi:hypothetical protein
MSARMPQKPGGCSEPFGSIARERMMSKKVRPAVATIAALLFVGKFISVQAAENPALNVEILRLSLDWEHVRFQIDNRDEQEKQMAVLAQHAADVAQRYKNRPVAVIWVGIITGEQALLASENSSPFKALGFAKSARDILEKVEKIDSVALDAAAPTVLGVLYSRVPTFPIGFGDKSKARHGIISKKQSRMPRMAWMRIISMGTFSMSSTNTRRL